MSGSADRSDIRGPTTTGTRVGRCDAVRGPWGFRPAPWGNDS